MQIVEVKNNLVKVSYNTAQENLILSGFVVIKDEAQSFIGQIIHLEADSKGNFAIVKLLFNFDYNGVITNYNGSIPAVTCPIDTVESQELLELLPAQNPVWIGDLAQQQTTLTVDRGIFEQKLLVCSEQEEDNSLLIQNFASQLTNGGKKVLVVDLAGTAADLAQESDYSVNRVVAGEDFKLPLNYESINFIYEKGLDDAKAETKALIQDVFLEVQNYVKTLSEKFIPFETFKNVVDSQYEEIELVELVLLKNKLLKYYEAGIFAQEKGEFNTLRLALENDAATVFDLSGVEPEIQREMIAYAYSLISDITSQGGEEIYVLLNLENANSDKKLLKQIFSTKGCYSTPICAYSYKYLKELKQISKNLILFAPIQQQNDFASYNVFLNKLNADEFIIYGPSTRHLPLIIKLNPVPKFVKEPKNEDKIAVDSESQTIDLLDEQIKKDVDEIYTSPRSEEQILEGSKDELIEGSFVEDALTEDDLDLIDGLNILESLNSEAAEVSFPKSGLDVEDRAHESEELWVADESELTDEPVAEVEIPDGQEPELEIITEGHESNEEAPAREALQPESFESLLSPKPEESDILPISESSTPIVPIYSADVEPTAQSDELLQGDIVMHAKYGKGTVEKLINYGSKTLCSINFDNVGRRLLDPSLAEIKKV